jgi:anaerobic selenocysteine-containing dehydrogenase
LRIHPKDAAALGCAEGDWVRLTTRRGSAETLIELSDAMQPGHVSLPNGHGIDYRDADGVLTRKACR